MDAADDARRWAQLVFADTSAAKAVEAKSGVRMKMYVPKQRAAPGGAPKTLGGFMALPLRAVHMGGGTQRYDTSQFLDPRANGSGVTVVFDTGSQGFFIIDTTRGKDGRGLLATLPGGYGGNSGAYELELGDPDGPTFTVSIPEQWRDYVGAPSLITQPADPAPNTDSQTIILGNCWLQAVALTFDLPAMQAVLSHLDKDGNRVSAYAGPKSSVTPPLARGVAPYRLDQPRSSPFRDGSYLGPELEATSLARVAPPEASRPKASDVTLDLRIMAFSSFGRKQKGGTQLIASEVRGTRDQVMFTLDADVQLADGRVTRVSKIVDTGSGVNLLLDTDFAPETDLLGASNGAEYCQNGGTVAQVFSGAAALGAAPNARCGPCADDLKGAHQSGGGFCNDFCCTPENISCSTQLPCAVSFCTGVLAYKPAMAKLKLASENGTELLQSLASFAGNASAACTPAPTIGIWGFWFWDSAPKNPDAPSGTVTRATALPYYVLAQLGQLRQDLENYTLKFWRSDLGQGSGAVAVGRPPLAKIPGPNGPVWQPTAPGAPAPAGRPPAAKPPAFAPGAPAFAPGAPAFPPAAPAFPPAAPAFPPAAPAFSPAAPAFPPAFPPATPGPAPTGPGTPYDPTNIGREATYSRNAENGVQQVVVIEKGAFPGCEQPGADDARARTPRLAQSAAPPGPAENVVRPLLLALLALLGVFLLLLVVWLLRGRAPASDVQAIFLDGSDVLS